MTTMIRQQLSQKLIQKLSPQQIQLMKLLQIPTMALDQRIQEELEANPALEEGAEEEENFEQEFDQVSEQESLEDSETSTDEEDYELDDYLNEFLEDDPGSYSSSDYPKTEEEDRKDIPFAVENSLQEYLIQQMNLLNIDSERTEAIALQIIGSIDDDGYLRREPVSITDDLLFSRGYMVEEHEVLETLKLIQKLDPPGIGARDLRECLLIQLMQKREQDSEFGIENQMVGLAIKILDKYFLEFSKKHYDKLTKALNIEDETLRGVIEEVLKLNPKPASGYNQDKSENNNYIIPDFIIFNRDGVLELSLHGQNSPELRVSDHYREMLRVYSKGQDSVQKLNRQDKEAVVFIKQKIDSARWFIDAIQKRQNTMYRTMDAIMQFQYDYFLTGDDRKLKPMILKDISDITNLDISTVSRVANNKYVQTEFGTKKVKEFFSESVQNLEGEEVSTLEVKQILMDILNDEDKRKPLSDEDLKELLKEKGYNIARRTVAKYREQLNIPVARLRKIL